VMSNDHDIKIGKPEKKSLVMDLWLVIETEVSATERAEQARTAWGIQGGRRQLHATHPGGGGWQWATLETAIRLFRGWPAHRAYKGQA
jgi:hypothetical protein